MLGVFAVAFAPSHILISCKKYGKGLVVSTSREFLEFILDNLSGLDGITHRMMMGEYIIYYHGKISALVCDDRLLVKPVPSALRLLPDAVFEPPYKGAKEMLLVDDVDDRALLQRLFVEIESELP